MNTKHVSLVAIACASALVSFAENYTWNGGASGEWTSSANWLPATGYPNGADDTAAFSPSAATAVTVGSAVSVKGITVDGSGALMITGSAITLGASGIASASTAAVGISNDLAVATAATPLAVAGPATLSTSTPAGPLHLAGVISGEGGLAKTGAGALHLYGANTFTGGFASEGNSKRPNGTTISSSSKSYTLDASSEVFIYNGAALGGGTVTFDKGASTSNIKGSRLTLMAPMTILNVLALSGDYADGNGSMKVMASGTYHLKGNVSGALRLRIGYADGVEVHYEGTVSCPNWHSHDKIGSTGVYSIHYDGILSVSVLTGSNTKANIYLNHSGNSFSQNQTMTVTCGAEDAYSSRFSGIWRWDSNNTKVDLGGFDQTIKSYVIGSYREGANVTQHGFLSATPAKVRFIGAECSNLSFGGRFYDAAGLEWHPTVEGRTLTLTNATPQTTRGDIVVSSGTLRLANGATFTALGRLSVGASGTLSVDAGVDLFATNVALAAGAKIVFTGARAIRCIYATIDGAPLPDGRYDRESEEVSIEGNGVLVVDSTSNIWKGGASGDWGDPSNWSLGMVPQTGQSATLGGACTVLLAESTPQLKEVVVGAAATLVASNWTTCIRADRVSVSGNVTCAGPFTNEVAKSRVWIQCGELDVSALGAIDVSAKGWMGGANGTIGEVGTNRVNRAGWGPGGARISYNGASHMGLGAYTQYNGGMSKVYDNPFAPVEPGSGGYGLSSTSTARPDGGGAVRIEATGAVTVDGSILADGDSAYAVMGGNTSLNDDTGASGGAIWITCGTIAGSGRVSAAGGNGRYGVYPATMLGRGTNSPNLAGGGGGIRIEYDAAQQTSSSVSGMTVSAAAGVCLGGERLTYPIMDRYHTEAEPGTVTFTDGKIVDALIGKGLSGRIMGLDAYTYPGDLEFSYGHVRFATTGVTVNVTGSLVVTGEWSRLDIGGVFKRVYASRPYVVAGDEPVSLNVAGSLTISNGAALAVYAAATNATDGWGGVVTVDGAFTVGAGGIVYPASDYVNTGSPRFRVGSFTVEEGGIVDANERGGSGGWQAGLYQARYGGEYATRQAGCGIGAGNGTASAGHGGAGAISYIDTSAYSGHGTYPASKSGIVCDDPYKPTFPGAGGGVQGYGYAGDGGGIFFLESPGAIRVDGTIQADGGFGSYIGAGWMYQFGSGAGGAVFLGGGTFVAGATARLSARGGDCGLRIEPAQIFRLPVEVDASRCRWAMAVSWTAWPLTTCGRRIAPTRRLRRTDSRSRGLWM